MYSLVIVFSIINCCVVFFAVHSLKKYWEILTLFFGCGNMLFGFTVSSNGYCKLMSYIAKILKLLFFCHLLLLSLKTQTFNSKHWQLLLLLFFLVVWLSISSSHSCTKFLPKTTILSDNCIVIWFTVSDLAFLHLHLLLLLKTSSSNGYCKLMLSAFFHKVCWFFCTILVCHLLLLSLSFLLLKTVIQ